VHVAGLLAGALAMRLEPHGRDDLVAGALTLVLVRAVSGRVAESGRLGAS
jgi:hypothetical protein